MHTLGIAVPQVEMNIVCQQSKAGCAQELLIISHLGGVGEKKQNEGGGWGGVVKLFLSRFHEHSCHPPECL